MGLLIFLLVWFVGAVFTTVITLRIQEHLSAFDVIGIFAHMMIAWPLGLLMYVAILLEEIKIK